MEKKHSISVISGSCGVKAHTLRIWEKRYNLFSPERTDTGKRLYSDEDIRKANLIVELMQHGYAISALASYSNKDLEDLLSERKSTKISPTPSQESLQVDKLFEYLAKYDLKGIADEIQYARLNTGAREFILGLVLPTIREIGLKVYKGEYSISQEHIISTIIRDQISQIFLPNIGKASNEIALATPEGNLHEFSILVADILTRSHRITTRYLGATHPADCLGQALNALKTPILVLGVISSDQWDYGKNMIPYLERLDRTLKSSLEVILGGGFDLDFPEFKKIKKIRVFKTFEEFDEYLARLV